MRNMAMRLGPRPSGRSSMRAIRDLTPDGVIRRKTAASLIDSQCDGVIGYGFFFPARTLH